MADINGIPYVEATDLVSGYPATSLALATELDDQLASKLDLAGGKILQIVEATDGTNRTTTSTSFVDVTGISASITPQFATSDIIILVTGNFRQQWNSGAGQESRSEVQITDSSNNVISGAGDIRFGLNIAGFAAASDQINDHGLSIFGIVSAVDTAARSYKLRFRSVAAATTTSMLNLNSAGRIYAIEVSA